MERKERPSPGEGGTEGLLRGRFPARIATALLALSFALVVAGPSLAQEETTAGGRGTPTETVPGEPIAPPKIEAGSWALMDTGSGRLLGGANQDERRQLGSTTRLSSRPQPRSTSVRCTATSGSSRARA